MIELCEQVWQLVSPVLTHDSPEGNFRTYHFPNGPLITQSELRDEFAQELLSSCWRSVKEASALLGKFLSLSSATVEDCQSGGMLFLEWLSRIRHRGAFSAVMPAFEGLCAQCFHDEEKNLKCLPSIWINVLII